MGLIFRLRPFLSLKSELILVPEFFYLTVVRFDALQE